MSKSTKVSIFLVGIILIGGVYLLMNGVTSPPITVTSSDGEATLTIPRDALPADISPADITITKESVKNFFGIEGNEEEVSAYKLSPDGLVLLQPARITIRTPRTLTSSKELEIPFVFHKSGSTIDIVDNTTVDFSDDGKMLSFSGDISHFSWIAIPHLVSFIAFLEPDEIKVKVGDTFPARLRIFEKSHSDDIRDGRALFAVATGTRWQVNNDNMKHFMLSTGGTMFTPEKWSLPTKEMNAGEEYIVDQNYTCVRPGVSTLLLRENLVIDYTPVRVVPTWEKQPNGKHQTEEVLQPERIIVNNVFQTYLYECTAPESITPRVEPTRVEPGGANTDAPSPVKVTPAPSTGGNKAVICGLPGGPACPKR